MIGKRKLVLIGTGFVGMSMAYAILCQGSSSGVNELVLIDIQKEKAIGEAMDLAHGLSFSSSHMQIRAGEYSECSDADIVVITAGLNQKPGQTRLELSLENAKIMKSITEEVVASGFKGIFLIASNPVDLMTKVVQEVSGFEPHRVIGSGTASSKNIHAYIMGEHGDSSFVPWEHAYAGCKKVTDVVKDLGKDLSDLDKIYIDVRDAAYEIINRKKATYYGIGIALAKIVRNILNNTNEIFTVSAYLNGEYGQKDIYIGVPVVLNNEGARELVELDLAPENKEKLNISSNILRENMEKIREVL